eukprot:TRINITY_DN6954_c0_g1_i1.p1 TRINITY_DN6954_c0_g1~~TRINITY_DN6954_c0_g1_i1.p1  ORF type:complete len:600 (+),score=88.59 TRINITY_DN6954_c0_g1_i1:79-1878(+)
MLLRPSLCLASRKIHAVGSSRKVKQSCRVLSRCVSSQTRDMISPQRQLEENQLVQPKMRLPEVMKPELKTQYNALVQLTSGAQAQIYKEAKFDSYANLIKKLIIAGHILEGAELLGVVKTRFPAKMTDMQVSVLFELFFEYLALYAINSLTIRALPLVVPLLQSAKPISTRSATNLLYCILSCNSFTLISPVLEAVLRCEEMTSYLLTELMRAVFLYGQNSDVERLEKYIDDKQSFRDEEVLLEYIRKISGREPLRSVAVWIKYRSFVDEMTPATIEKILDKLTKTLFVLNLGALAPDIVDLMKKKNLLDSVAAYNVVQLLFRSNQDQQAEQLVADMRAAGVEYTSDMFLSLVDERSGELLQKMLTRVFGDPACKLRATALISSVIYFMNQNDDSSAEKFFRKLLADHYEEMYGNDIGRLLEYVEYLASKVNYFDVDFSAHSRRESYIDQINKFCEVINRIQWKTRAVSSKGIHARPALMNMLLSLLGRVGPTPSLMDALDRLVYHSAAISGVNIIMALKYAVVLDAVPNSAAEAFIQRHKLRLTKASYTKFLTGNVVPEFSSFWRKVSPALRKLDPLYSAQMIQAQGIRIPKEEDLTE